MALSTCVRCGSSSFELVDANVTKAAFKLYFVQCSACGGVVAVQEYNNLGALLVSQNVALTRIAAALNVRVDLQT